MSFWLFTFIQMFAGGLFLVFVSGRVTQAAQTLRSPVVWLYGVLRVMTAAFFTAALLHASAATAAFLSILSVPTSALFLWTFFRRTPARWEWVGHAIILGALSGLAFGLEDGWRNPAVVLMILSELCVFGSTVIAELHPQNQSDDPKERVGLTGVFLLSSAAAMLLAVAILSTASIQVFGARLTWLDAPADLLDPRLWIAAFLFGIVLRGPSMFFALAAIHRVQTANYLAAMAMLPVTVMMFEGAFVRFGWLPPTDVWISTTAFGLAAVFGSLVIVGIRAWSR